MSKELQALIKKNRVYAFLHLPHCSELDDSFLNFNQVTTLQPGVARSANRLLSLSDLGRRYKLYRSMIGMGSSQSNQLREPRSHFDTICCRKSLSTNGVGVVLHPVLPRYPPVTQEQVRNLHQNAAESGLER